MDYAAVEELAKSISSPNFASQTYHHARTMEMATRDGLSPEAYEDPETGEIILRGGGKPAPSLAVGACARRLEAEEQRAARPTPPAPAAARSRPPAAARPTPPAPAAARSRPAAAGLFVPGAVVLRSPARFVPRAREAREAREAALPTLQSFLDAYQVDSSTCVEVLAEPRPVRQALLGDLMQAARPHLAPGVPRDRVNRLLAAAVKDRRRRKQGEARALAAQSAARDSRLLGGLAALVEAGAAAAGRRDSGTTGAERAEAEQLRRLEARVRRRERRLEEDERLQELEARLHERERRLAADSEALARRLEAEDRRAARPSAAPAPRPRAAPRRTTSAFDAPVSKAELQRRFEAFADAEGLDDGCRAALKRYAARDADGCVRFLRAAPGDVGKVPVDKRSAFVVSAIKAEYLLAASASELEALAPELRRVADALALTSDVARALKPLSRVDQRRVAERLADPGGLLFGMLSRNGWIRADLSKGKTGNLLQEKLWRPSVDAALVAALDGRRLSNHCYRALRDLDPERQALCALALEAADLSKLTDLSGYIEKGLEKGTLLRKGQELMDARPSEAPRSEAPRPAPPPRDEDDAPEEFLCPISMEVMQDPVIAADGHTYERRAIEAWFERAQTSPTTNEPLPHVNLIPNHTIRSMINSGSRF